MCIKGDVRHKAQEKHEEREKEKGKESRNISDHLFMIAYSEKIKSKSESATFEHRKVNFFMRINIRKGGRCDEGWCGARVCIFDDSLCLSFSFPFSLSFSRSFIADVKSK